MDPQLHIARLESCLAPAARQAFEQVQRSHAGEQFYAFGLMSSGEAIFILPAANTEEALRRRFGRRVDASEEPWLRWNPAEWDYLYEGREHFAQVQDVLEEFNPYARDITDEQAEAHITRNFGACVGVLRGLDEEGVFGRGPARQRAVVLLLKGDQSYEERIAWAKQLNPEPVWRRFEAELQAAAAALEQRQREGSP